MSNDTSLLDQRAEAGGSATREKRATNLMLEVALKAPAEQYAEDRRQSLSAVINEVLEERLIAAGYLPPKRIDVPVAPVASVPSTPAAA